MMMLPATERKERPTAARQERQVYTTVGQTAEPKEPPTAARPERRECTTAGLTAGPKDQPTAALRENPAYMTVGLTAGPESCSARGAAALRGCPALADRAFSNPDVWFGTIGSR
jgi:hypothetical protein